MEKDIYRSQFRLPYDLYEKLKKSADNNSRSLNAELIVRLESSFHSSLSPNTNDPNTAPVELPKEILAELHKMALERLSKK